MRYGISILSIVPIRSESSDKAEMINQVLFGEHFKVLTTQGVAASQKIGTDLFMNQLLANAPKRFFIKELAFIFKDSK